MEYTCFSQLESDIDELYNKGKYQDSLQLIKKGVKELPDQELDKHYFEVAKIKIILYLKTKNFNKCLDFVEKVIDNGFALPLHFSSFNPLKEYKKFKKIKVKNDHLIAQKQENTKYKYEVHLPEDYNRKKNYPIFFALHGDGYETGIEEFSEYWKPGPFIQHDIIFVYVQSSQVLSEKGYGWFKDPQVAREDIRNCYGEIKTKYQMDEELVLIGGYSGGAITSLDIAMANVIPVKGVIGLCPEIKPEAFTKKNVEKAAQRGVKCYLMEGEEVLPIKDEEEIIELFEETGLQYKYVINKGVGHVPPKDFSTKLESAINYLLE